MICNLTPIALIGASGIGKTSIALTALHDNRISRLSEVSDADIESPGDLVPLRPLPPPTEMLIILDNAESVLDLWGTDMQEIYAVVE